MGRTINQTCYLRKPTAPVNRNNIIKWAKKTKFTTEQLNAIINYNNT